jgi:hypothetical protein
MVAASVPLIMRLPLQRVRRLLEPSPQVSIVTNVGQEIHLLALVDLVLDLTRPILRPDCQVRGLTRYYVLRRAGVDVSLAFGLGWPNGVLAGHCWLVKDDEPYMEPRDPRPVFTETLRFTREALRPAC